MKKWISTLTAFLITGAVYSQTVNFSWVQQGGGTLADIGFSIAIDGAGNVYNTGTFQGVADFDPGPGGPFTAAGASDIFLSKYDATGAFLWAIAIGGAGVDASRAMAIDGSGNIYITGTFNGTVDFDPTGGVVNLTGVNQDVFVAKFDGTTGTLVWAKQMGGAGPDDAFSITLDVAGANVYTTGFFTGPANFDPNGIFNLAGFGGIDIFVSNLDASGNFVWAREMGGTTNDFGTAVKVDPDGNIVNTGVFSGTADLDPGGTTVTFNSAGGDDSYITKINAAGGFVWTQQIAGTGDDQINSVALDPSGNIHTTGFFDGTTDFDPDATGVASIATFGGRDIFILKLTDAGVYVWARTMGNNANLAPGDRDIGTSIAVDGSSNVYTVGSFAHTVDFDPGGGIYDLTATGDRDVFLSILNASGNFVLAGRVGAAGVDQAESIALSATGAIHMTGRFENTVDFDPSAGTANLVSAGVTDVFVLQLSQLLATPLTLIDFTVKLGNQSAQLNWRTATEENTSHFEIEKSTNGTNYSKIGSIKASGNSSSTKSYSFTDQQALNGNNYYRLKMIDVDGKFTYSKVVVVKVNGNTTLQVFPNPAKNILFVQATGNDKNSLLRITDAAGKIVKEQRIALNGTISFSVDISNLPRGLYYFTLKDAVRIQQQTIIKQ